MRDLWVHKDMGILDNKIVCKVNPHGVMMFKITPIIQVHDPVEM